MRAASSSSFSFRNVSRVASMSRHTGSRASSRVLMRVRRAAMISASICMRGCTRNARPRSGQRLRGVHASFDDSQRDLPVPCRPLGLKAKLRSDRSSRESPAYRLLYYEQRPIIGDATVPKIRRLSQRRGALGGMARAESRKWFKAKSRPFAHS